MSLSNKNLIVPVVFLLASALFITSCARKQVIRRVHKEAGMASWYGPGFHGRKTASGERYNQWKMTAAHKTLPFGTKVKVTNVDNEKFVFVVINDRGPYRHGRIIDLSKAAAKKLDFLGSGVTKVVIEVIPDRKKGFREAI